MLTRAPVLFWQVFWDLLLFKCKNCTRSYSISFPVHHHLPPGTDHVDRVWSWLWELKLLKVVIGVGYEVCTLRIQRGFVDEVINVLHALLMSLKALIIHAFHCLHRVWHAACMWKTACTQFSLENRRPKCRWEDGMEDVDQIHVAQGLVVGFREQSHNWQVS